MFCETAFALGDLVGFTPTRPSVYVQSCMIRNAYKTVIGIQEMHSELVGKARESSCLHIAYTEIKPAVWDSLAFCSNLFHASQLLGLRHGSLCKVSLARAMYEWRSSVRPKSFSLQKSIQSV